MSPRMILFLLGFVCLVSGPSPRLAAATSAEATATAGSSLSSAEATAAVEIEGDIEVDSPEVQQQEPTTLQRRTGSGLPTQPPRVPIPQGEPTKVESPEGPTPSITDQATTAPPPAAQPEPDQPLPPAVTQAIDDETPLTPTRGDNEQSFLPLLLGFGSLGILALDTILLLLLLFHRPRPRRAPIIEKRF